MFCGDSVYNSAFWTIAYSLYGSFLVALIVVIWGGIRERWIIYAITCVVLWSIENEIFPKNCIPLLPNILPLSSKLIIVNIINPAPKICHKKAALFPISKKRYILVVLVGIGWAVYEIIERRINKILNYLRRAYAYLFMSKMRRCVNPLPARSAFISITSLSIIS